MLTANKIIDTDLNLKKFKNTNAEFFMRNIYLSGEKRKMLLHQMKLGCI